MQTPKRVSFTVEKFGDLIPIKDTRFAKVRLWAFASGDNRNNLPVSVASLKKAENSIYGQPVLWHYNSNKDDAGGHDMEEVPCGFVSTKPEEVNISYELTEDGRIFFCFDALIWKMYSGKLLEIMARTDNVKKVSVEMLVEDFGEIEGKQSLETFYYTGTTILGEDVLEAVPDARIELTSFSTDKEEYFKAMEEKEPSKEGEKVEVAPTEELEEGVFAKEDLGTGEAIKKNLSKESAFSDSWGDVDKAKLRNDLLKAKNYSELIKACYLIILDGWEDAPSEKLKYPVCMISNGELVLAEKGCESALAYLEQNTNDPNYSSAKSKLKKYYKTLDLSVENFETEEGEQMQFNKDEFAKTFEMTNNELKDALRESISMKRNECDDVMYWLQDFDSEYLYVTDHDTYKTYAMKYQKLEEGSFVVDFESAVEVKQKYVLMEEKIFEKVEEEDKESDKEESDSEDDKEDEDSPLKEFVDAKVAKAKEEATEETMKANEEAKSELEKKVEEMSVELESLKEFKANVEKEAKNTEKERILNSFEAVLSSEQMSDWREKSHEFESIEVFTQSLKAFAFDFGIKNATVQTEDSLITAIPVSAKAETGNVYDRIKSKLKK